MYNFEFDPLHLVIYGQSNMFNFPLICCFYKKIFCICCFDLIDCLPSDLTALTENFENIVCWNKSVNSPTSPMPTLRLRSSATVKQNFQNLFENFASPKHYPKLKSESDKSDWTGS
jgi:hypothetical protein